MKHGVRIKTPVTRSLKSLRKDPLPKKPLILHLTEADWAKLSEGIPVSRRKIGPDAKGMFVLPDPFGGFLGFFACAAGSGEGVACLPEIVRKGGTITFGGGCTCIRGKDPVDPPTPVVDSCSLALALNTGRLTCVGTCTCHLVRKPVGTTGRVFITCECS
jgi:hypothetical protein